MLIVEFKRLFNKADFDFDAAEIDFYHFHPQLRILLAVNGIFFNNRESKLRFLWPFVSVGLTLVGVVIEVMIIFHSMSVSDLSAATECFAYAVIISVVLVLCPCTLLRRKQLFEIVDEMVRDFDYVCRLPPRFRDAFLAGQLQIWQMGLLWLCFLMVITFCYCSMTLLGLLYVSLFKTLDEHTVRPLPFPLWLPEDDPYRTPNYEVFLVVQYVILSVVVLTFGACCAGALRANVSNRLRWCVFISAGYVYFLLHFLLHNLNQLDMSIVALGGLFERVEPGAALLPRGDPRRARAQALLNARLGQIVTWHNGVFANVRKVLDVYGPTLVYQVFFSSFVICLLAYQVADHLDRGTFHLIFALLAVGACVQLWVPCYLGTTLQNKGFAVGDACWHSGWHETPLSRMVAVDLCVIMMRSQRPIALQIAGIPPLNLERFSSIMSTAYSYFNMLRQVKVEM